MMPTTPRARPSTTVLPCERQQPVRHVKVRASMFFDGTQNNANNTRARLAWERGGSRGDAPGSGSYENDFSNVSKLSDTIASAQPGYDIAINIYVSGIGTTNGDSDSMLTGVAFGQGDTGVITKVDRAVTALVSQIASRVGPASPTLIIDFVHIDSFGFSRGAAAARHFVHKAMRVGPTVAARLRARGYALGDVRIRFVGLFDTVASFGVVHRNDTRDLDLDAISIAEKVVHLAAAEEYRENFRLTNINSAGNGLQYFLPGAHSDVGGGYADGSSEVDWRLFQYVDTSDDGMGGGLMSGTIRTARDADYSWMVSRGWYTPSQLTRLSYFGLEANRRGISNHYPRIPLQMMGQQARTLSLVFTPALGINHAVPAALARVKAAIETAVANGRAGRPQAWFGPRDAAWQAFRNRYLHFSSHYEGIGNDPEWSTSPLTGERRRIIQNG